MCRKPILLISLILLAALVNSAAAQTWTNATGNRKWNDPLNWSGSVVPGIGATALINPPPLEGPVVNCNVNVKEIQGPKHNSASDQVMIVIADGNTINVTDNWYVADGGTGVGALLIGGTPTINIGDRFRCADQGDGTTAIVDVSGNPTINIDGAWRNADENFSFVDIDISGGTINVGGYFRIGDNGSGAIDVYGGTLNVDEDWSLNCRPPTSWAAFGMYGGQVSIAGDLIMVQSYGTGMAFLDMDDGTINIGDNLELPGGNGMGIFYMTGGNVNINGHFELGGWGTGDVHLCGGTIRTSTFGMRTSGGIGTMSICCLGKLIVDDPNGSVKATIDEYVADGWITCIDSYCSEVTVAWNGTTTTVSCQPFGRKWSQPPIETDPISQIPNYCGWDQNSFTEDPCGPWQIVADDFRCLGTMPITAIHFWGSYDGWSRYYLPEPAPVAWRIGFWSNVPAGLDPNFSYPKELLWQIEAPAERVHSEWVGTDELDSDLCFRHYLNLEPNEWFLQDQFLADTNDDIYWLSIAAVYDPCEFVGDYEWGWKTRPWSWMDDAVRFEVDGNLQPGIVLDPCDNYIEPLEYGGESFDVSFELVTDPNYIKHEQPFTGIRDWPHYEDELSMMVRGPVTMRTKWVQPPDETEDGIDVRCDRNDGIQRTLADDFLCTTTGPITKVILWGSWRYDDKGEIKKIHLSIHSDDPCGPGGYSEPNELLWEKDFFAPDIYETLYRDGDEEWWWDPVFNTLIQWCDRMIWQYEINIGDSNQFIQQGDPCNPVVYWLDVYVEIDPCYPTSEFGWKTSTEHWNDDAVWSDDDGNDPNELRYPTGHPSQWDSIDLAFEIETTEQGTARGVRGKSSVVADAIVNDTGMTLTLSVKDGYNITQDGAFDVIEMEEFALTSAPGDPMLPHKLYDILLPPDALESTVELNIVSAKTRTLDGTYNIKPAGPDVAWVDGKRVEVWGDDKTIVDGRNVDVYQTDADFPETSVKLLLHSQMRKWKFVRVDFNPIQYNPVSGKLTLTESVQIQISYSKSLAAADVSLMADTAWDHTAARRFVNYTQVKDLYDQAKPTKQLPARVTNDYVIITTNAIAAGSTNLNNFKTHKQGLGHTVLVATYENDIASLTGQAPNNRAEKIRQWLKNNYASMGIEYVLLIGDPDPCDPCDPSDPAGDIPMKMCHPNRNQTNPDVNDTPTDYFYADLTGNWDIDGDLLYGEWDADGDGAVYSGDYPVTTGVDFTPEVYVGRIPVYDANYAALDSILQKMMDYENESAGARNWRRSALLPMGFQQANPLYDGAPLAEQMRNDYLLWAGYSNWRMYQQGNGPGGNTSSYTSEEELRGSPGPYPPPQDTVENEWTNDAVYGIVCWWAHGSATRARVGYSGCWDGTLFQSSYCPSLDNNHPAFTYQCSCSNGYPETSNNLQYAILEQGGIATVGATRNSFYNDGVGYGQFDGSTTNSGIGYEYVDRLVQNLPAGDALYEAKASMSPTEWASRLANWYGFNLYGDPALAIGVEPTGGPRVKWTQPPDETEDGIDIRCDRSDGIQRTLADDFLCATTGPITKVVLWGSWRDDYKGEIKKIHLSVHGDDPCGPGGWSEPNDLLWEKDFYAPDIYETLYRDGDEEWWWDPPTREIIQWCDSMIWKYEINIDEPNQFIQQGDPCNPVVYWLDVYVEIDPCYPLTEFGWKTSTEHWNDDAVWSDDDGNDPNELRYPIGHPSEGDSIDLAFEIWTQPEAATRVVADDWPCDQNTPITAAAWWGSHIGYRYEACQQQQMPPPVKPDYFQLSMWTDAPATGPTKWSQEPDLDTTGMDVLAGPRFIDLVQNIWYETFLADDFECTQSGPVTGIHIWASYNEDERLTNQPRFSLVIYDNVPAGTDGIPYSRPNTPLWDAYVQPTAEWVYATADESFYDPNSDQIIGWDTQVWRFDFEFDPNDPNGLFIQEEGQIYWLGVHHTFDLDDDGIVGGLDVVALRTMWPGGPFGWKTSLDHFEDDGVWTKVDSLLGNGHVVPSGEIWNELRYPSGHAFDGNSIDLAFEISTAEGLSYSHPKDKIWEYKAYDYDDVLVGYDKHPEGEPNEPVFRYSVWLPEEDWFCQEEPNSVYWFSVVAAYDENTPNYDWGWTNHEHVYNDNAVAGYVDATGAWVWEELYDQTELNSVDMSFTLFTEPDPNAGTCWDAVNECGGQPSGDATCDGNVNFADLFALKLSVFKSVGQVGYNCCADFNHDGSVDFADLFILKFYVFTVGYTPATGVQTCPPGYQ